MYEIDWQAVSEWWNSLNIAVQFVLGIATTYTTGVGGASLIAQLCRGGHKTYTAAKAWLKRPSRVAVVEEKLTALLIKLGEASPGKMHALGAKK